MKRITVTVLVMLILFTVCACGSSGRDFRSAGPQISAKEEAGYFEEEVYFEKTVETDVYYDRSDISFEDTYTCTENGNTYVMELKESSVTEAPINGRTAELKYSQNFVNVKEDDLPKSVSVKYYEDGREPIEGIIVLKDTDGTIDNLSEQQPQNDSGSSETHVYSVELPLVSAKAGEPVWTAYSAPMTFTDYGAAYYRLSEGVYIPHSETAPSISGYEKDILKYLGLSAQGYTISSAAWKGEPYEKDGVLCRDATMYGQRLVGTTVATYQAKIQLDDVTGYKGTATYYFRGIVRNTRKIAAVTGGGAAAVGAGTIIPVVFFRRRRRRNEDADNG